MAALVNNGVNVELSHLAKQASEFLERLYPDGRLMEVSRGDGRPDETPAAVVLIMLKDADLAGFKPATPSESGSDEDQPVSGA